MDRRIASHRVFVSASALAVAALLMCACGERAPTATVAPTPPSTIAYSAPAPATASVVDTTPTTLGAANSSALPPLPPMGTLVPFGAETRSAEIQPSGARLGVAVFGDSLALQTWAYVQRIASDRGQPFTGGAYGGTALCDWVPSIERVLRDDRPPYLVLAFAGNNLTQCTLAPEGRRRFGAVLVELYRRDTQRVITAANAAGTKVFVVGPPAMRNAVWNDHATRLRVAMRQLAHTNAGVMYLDANRAITPGGFLPYRPCFSFETASIGCHDGVIVVRAPDGVHLSVPVGGYSAGAWRFANILMSKIPDAD